MNVRALSKPLQLKSEQELNELSNRVKSDIEYIRRWLKQQLHLNANLDDQFILTFLRGCKFNYKITKEKIECFYSTITLMPELFRNRDPLAHDIQHVLNTRHFWLPLPKSSDPLAPRILYYSGEPFDASKKIDLFPIIKTILIVMDILLHEDDSFIVNGYCVIHYLNGFTSNHLSQLPITLLKNLYTCFIKRYPLRLKQFHFMNVRSSIYVMYNLLKPFVSEKIRSRVCFHQTLERIHDFFSKAELPIELGGESYCIESVLDEWKDKIAKHRNWLIEHERFGTDESKRIEKVNYNPEMFGVQDLTIYSTCTSDNIRDSASLAIQSTVEIGTAEVANDVNTVDSGHKAATDHLYNKPYRMVTLP
ncbi:hypothetical protein RN001_007975 [Aquatica leii]|uniref:CRAL-TRIO domain-containing protein n=1 Tax=Aquatica leii TaxID=1421715 RepID=A0AAN7PX15_9COLE|nr:hypothetical protein RN001_007975 [Aquatica leii]